MAIQGYFGAPTTVRGNGPREQTQAEIDRLRARRMGILVGTGGVGLDQLPSIDAQIRKLEGQRDRFCPAPDQPAMWSPLWAAAGTTRNLGSALGPAATPTTGSFPGWM